MESVGELRGVPIGLPAGSLRLQGQRLRRLIARRGGEPTGARKAQAEEAVMSVMRETWSQSACRALAASGVKPWSLHLLCLPWGKEKRLRRALRHRMAVLEVKNAVVDALGAAQKALAPLKIRDLAGVERALQDQEQRPLVLTFGMNREMLVSELAEKYGVETGASFEEALAELLAEGWVLQVPGKMVESRADLYLLVHDHGRARWDVSEISRLLRQGRNYRAELLARERRETVTGRDRSYRL